MPFGPNTPFNAQQAQQQQQSQQYQPPLPGQHQQPRSANQHPFSRMGQQPPAVVDAPQASGGQALPADGRLKLAATKLEPGGAANASGSEGRRTRSGKFTLAQLRATDGIVPLQSGTNQFDSQRGKTGFGMPRNTQTRVLFADEGKRFGVEEPARRDALIRLQSGTNAFDSQKGITCFGTPRDVKGKHLKRIWELEFPDEETDAQMQVPVNQAPSNWNSSQQAQGYYPQQGTQSSQQPLHSPPAFQ